MSDWSENPNVRPEVASAVNWGRKLERERIIGLLESIRVGDDQIGRDYAIDLIKFDASARGQE
jgi:hypothetical protein